MARVLPRKTRPARSVLALEATCRLTCGRAVLLLARRWVVVSRRTILRLCVSQTYVFTSWRCCLVHFLTSVFWSQQVSELAEENEMRDLFERFGRVTRVFLARDRETQRAKGFAFISYADRADAQLACDKMDGCMFSPFPLFPGVPSTNTHCSQSVTVTLSCVWSSRSALDPFSAFITTFLAPLSFSFQAGLPTTWVKLFSFCTV